MLISRTDSIGDVILTLPMAGVIRKFYPGARIIFLGRSYTRDVAALSQFVDQFMNLDDIGKLPEDAQVQAFREIAADVLIHVFPQKKVAALARKAGIPVRIGTTNRLWHWWTCNVRVSLSRKNSPFHEAVLNLRLLEPLGIPQDFSAKDIPPYYGFTKLPQLPGSMAGLVGNNKIKIILHPRSKGSAREWGLDNFENLIAILPAEQYELFISGTADDAASMQDWLAGLKKYSHVKDITGKMKLSEFIAFINACDGLVAASTGPLHIAAALGKKAVGLFSSRRPIHPGRWAPLGIQAAAVVWNADCPDCAAGRDCDCITRISAEQVKKELQK